jgi:adenosylmethionine-8-amino-7-oxononanoate aminotransferase
MGHATAVAAALAAQKAIRSENLLEKIVARGKAIRAGLRDALADHEHVGDIRGRGLFIGVEFVADRNSKKPFDAVKKIHKLVQKTAMQNGVLCYGMGGTIDGRRGDHILIAPPYNINDAEQAELIEKISTAVSATLASVDLAG